jgi:hypothetical protein
MRRLCDICIATCGLLQVGRAFFSCIQFGFQETGWNGILKKESHISVLRNEMVDFDIFGMGVANVDAKDVGLLR